MTRRDGRPRRPFAATTRTGYAARPALYTAPVITVYAVVLLGFSSNMLLHPVLPLYILTLGGGPALVGLVFATFTLPSVVIRPLMGRLADEWSLRRVFLSGTSGLFLSGLLYLVPHLAGVFITRVLHGASWAAFNTGGHAAIARLAPRERRGEAAAVFTLMPGIASTVLPAAGILLWSATGSIGPFILSAVLGAAATAVLQFGRMPGLAAIARPDRLRGSDRIVERGAVLPMTLEFLFTSVQPLFFVYPPLWATSKGIPVEALVVYYGAYGVVLVVARAVAGRYIDRVSRTSVIALSAGLAIVGLGVASIAESVLVMTLAGAVYATATAVASPAAMALAIDRADARRLGSAMATYSLGYQLGLGTGAATWGLVIQLAGFPAPFVLATSTPLAVFAILLVSRMSFRRGARA